MGRSREGVPPPFAVLDGVKGQEKKRSACDLLRITDIPQATLYATEQIRSHRQAMCSFLVSLLYLFSKDSTEGGPPLPSPGVPCLSPSVEQITLSILRFASEVLGRVRFFFT